MTRVFRSKRSRTVEGVKGGDVESRIVSKCAERLLGISRLSTLAIGGEQRRVGGARIDALRSRKAKTFGEGPMRVYSRSSAVTMAEGRGYWCWCCWRSRASKLVVGRKRMEWYVYRSKDWTIEVEGGGPEERKQEEPRGL